MTIENEQPIEEPINVLTWEQVRERRDQLLTSAEACYNFDCPQEMLTAWQTFKQELRDLPETYKDLEDLQLIQWPQMPTGHLQNLTISRYAPH